MFAAFSRVRIAVRFFSISFGGSPRKASFEPSSTIAASGRSASDQSSRESPPAVVSPETPALITLTR